MSRYNNVSEKSYVLFSIDNVEDPRVLNQFLNFMISTELDFKLMIGSYIMQHGEMQGMQKTEISFFADADLLGVYGVDEFCVNQESLIVFGSCGRDGTRKATMAFNPTLNRPDVDMGFVLEVNRTLALKNGEYTYDMQNNRYFIIVKPSI